MRYLAALFAAVLVMPASASNVCDDPQTQAAMNACSAQQLAVSDKELNRVWPLVRQWARETDAFNNNRFETSAEESLLKAQRAWIDYRDGHCMAVGAQYAGGSIQPLIINSCLADLTEKRTAELQELMEGM